MIGDIIVPKGIKGFIKGHKHSEETKIKIGNANRRPYCFNCDNCGKETICKPSEYRRKRRHFCSQRCYSEYRRDKMSPNEQPTWKGGVSDAESHRRWVAKNPERMAHLKARRYARERGANGSHTFEEWNALKLKHDNRCVKCGQPKPLTKDHIIPLSEGGTDCISNIQPLCRSCNSKKWKKSNELMKST